MWVTIFRLRSTTQKHPNYYCQPAEFPHSPFLGDIKLWECLPSAMCNKAHIQSKAIMPSTWTVFTKWKKSDTNRKTSMMQECETTPNCGTTRYQNFPHSLAFTQLLSVNLPQLVQIWHKTPGVIIKKVKMALLWCSKMVPQITSRLLILCKSKLPKEPRSHY